MLELDGYDDAVTLLCQCPGFESIENCADSANKRLAFADATEREVWLAEYQEKQCGVVCDHADECYGNVPACRDKRAGCECCFWKDGEFSCTNGACETCRTCSEIVTSKASGSDCVTSRALYRDVRQCACAECSAQCAGFCQGTVSLAKNGSDACSQCLADACADLSTACMADKP